ncbi:hypothetical protein ACFQ07_30340 [Actinomadura adrarensis]|uniref:Uncharacterized protein n=1 Tax=Actinomadura adrarensis TaxID=1819600 RepID=A0ABW3CQQ0_9ACTN
MVTQVVYGPADQCVQVVEASGAARVPQDLSQPPLDDPRDHHRLLVVQRPRIPLVHRPPIASLRNVRVLRRSLKRIGRAGTSKRNLRTGFATRHATREPSSSGRPERPSLSHVASSTSRSTGRPEHARGIRMRVRIRRPL